MTVVGISMVRDEEDIIEPVIRHMATQVDHLLVADNCSTDSTREILDSLERQGLPIEVVDDPDPAYFQSRKMSTLSRRAFAHWAADWVVPFDADEIWYAPAMRIGDLLSGLPPEIAIVSAELYDHVATGVDTADPNPITRTGWRRLKRAELFKTACRPVVHAVIGQGNHTVHYPADRVGGLVVRHFPYRSAEQFARKAISGAAAYAATDLPESQGAHWRGYGRIAQTFGEEALHDVFRQWFWVLDPAADKTLIYDPAPAAAITTTARAREAP